MLTLFKLLYVNSAISNGSAELFSLKLINTYKYIFIILFRYLIRQSV